MPLTGDGALNRQGIESRQLSRLRDLLAALMPGNQFYSAKLGAAAFDPQIESLDDFSKRFPFTLKRELIEDQLLLPPFGSNMTYPLARYSRFSQTSGTTGTPLRWLDTPASWDWMVQCWTRVFEQAGITAEDHVFFAASFGPFLGFWVGFEAAARMGCLCIPGGGMRSEARLRVILDTGATVLCCTPTYAIHLAEAASEEAIDLRAASVKTIIAAGEPGASIAGTRSRIEKLWNGARVVDHHGMTEIGPVTYGCPRRQDVLHVIESAFIAEVIDADRQIAVAPGATGELVLTNLGRLGSPLLRYRTGDVVRRGEAGPCECGTYDLALPGGILGRMDDMVVVRGVNVYPSAVENILQATGNVAEYRVEVRSIRALTELAIQIEPTPEHQNDAGLAHRIEAALRNAFGLRIAVSIVPCGALPRFEMKASRWARL